jgi:hypothetical protein
MNLTSNSTNPEFAKGGFNIQLFNKSSLNKRKTLLKLTKLAKRRVKSYSEVFTIEEKVSLELFSQIINDRHQTHNLNIFISLL